MKLLVGFDGSEVSKAAVLLAQKHARALKATVYIATSLERFPEDPLYKDVKLGSRAHLEERPPEYQKALEGLAYAKTLISDDAISCNTRILDRGLTPGEDLVEFAKEEGVDEIIIGARKRSKVGKLLFGSNAQYVVLNAECPVITIK